MILELDRPTIFPKEIIAAVSMRNAISFPPVGFSPGSRGALPSDEVLAEHRTILADRIGLPPDSLKFQQQVHGNVVRKIGRASEEIESDGMITDKSKIGLCVSIADCAAVLVYCAESRSIGAFHSGWHGTYLKICGRGIEMMQSEFGANPQSMFVYISPCAGGEAYEVGSEVAHLFSKIRQISEDKYTLDIRAEIRAELIVAGIPAEHIECSEVCTILDDRYHSYRRDHKCSGRMVAVIAMS